MDWILENWATLLLSLAVFIDVIVRVSPSKSDDKVWNFLRVIIDAVTGSKRKTKRTNKTTPKK